MKKSGFTFLFIIVCVGVLVAAYGVGVCIREIRFRGGQEETDVTAKDDKPDTEAKPEGVAQKPTPPDANQAPETSPAVTAQEPNEGPAPQMMGRFGGMPGMPTPEELQNMSEEERQAAMAKLRERFGGRRREGGPQLSEEDRAKFREEMEKVRERWSEMSDEEKKKVEAEFTEKYGFFPNPDRRRPGGFGGGRGGRRRGAPDDGQ